MTRPRNVLAAAAYLALGACAAETSIPGAGDWVADLPPTVTSIEVGPVQPGAHCRKPETLDAYTKDWCDRTGPAISWGDLS